MVGPRLRRLVGNRILTGALVVLAVIVVGVVGYSLGHAGGYASGYSAGYSDGNSDYNKIQESIKSTEVNYYGYLQLVLSKLAVDSQNKSVKSPSAGSHLRLAWLVLSKHSRIEAESMVAREIRRFAVANG